MTRAWISYRFSKKTHFQGVACDENMNFLQILQKNTLSRRCRWREHGFPTDSPKKHTFKALHVTRTWISYRISKKTLSRRCRWREHGFPTDSPKKHPLKALWSQILQENTLSRRCRGREHGFPTDSPRKHPFKALHAARTWITYRFSKKTFFQGVVGGENMEYLHTLQENILSRRCRRREHGFPTDSLRKDPFKAL